MTIFNWGWLPLAIIFIATIYAFLVFLALIVRTIARSRDDQTAEARVPMSGKPDVRGVISAGLASLALLCELVLVVTKQLPETSYMALFQVLFPILAVCAILSVVVSTLKGVSGIWGWSAVGLGLGMIALSGLSIWLLSPFLLQLR